MMCRKPYYHEGLPYGCGQCMPCRINRKREWTCRMVLESYAHQVSSFVTLTYDDDHIPMTSLGLATLDPGHVKNWLKRLRFKWSQISDTKLRYYLVGEYGDKTQRPHYHVALFGFPHCNYALHASTLQKSCRCRGCTLIRDTWTDGFTTNGYLSSESAGYVASYVTKGMTKQDDPQLSGRHPEFARMSTRPAIGVPGIGPLIEFMQSSKGRTYFQRTGDVLQSIKIGKREYPLGRHITDALRESVGIDKGCPDYKLVWRKLKHDGEIKDWLNSYTVKPGRHGSAVSIMDDQKVLNMETRLNIFKPRKVF